MESRDSRKGNYGLNQGSFRASTKRCSKGSMRVLRGLHYGVFRALPGSFSGLQK